MSGLIVVQRIAIRRFGFEVRGTYGYLQGSADEKDEWRPRADIIVLWGEGYGEAGHGHEEDGPHERCR